MKKKENINIGFRDYGDYRVEILNKQLLVRNLVVIKEQSKRGEKVTLIDVKGREVRVLIVFDKFSNLQSIQLKIDEGYKGSYSYFSRYLRISFLSR